MKANLEQKVNSNYIKKQKSIKGIGSTYEYLIENDKPKIIIKDSDGNLFLKADYKLLGIYNLYNSVFYWSYNLSYLNQLLVINKNNEYNKELLHNMKDYEDITYVEFINYITSNDNFFISIKNIDVIIKFSLYLHKKFEWCLPVCDSKVSCIIQDSDIPKKIEYIMLYNIAYYN